MNACQLGAQAFTTEPKCEDAPPPGPDSAPAPELVLVYKSWSKLSWAIAAMSARYNGGPPLTFPPANFTNKRSW